MGMGRFMIFLSWFLDEAVNGQTLKTVGDRIMLIEWEIRPVTVDDMRASLEAVYGLARRHTRHAQ